MIEILPFFPLFFGKPAEVPTINVTIDNQTEYYIDYMLNDISTLTVENNTIVVLDNLEQNQKLNIYGPEEQNVQVAINVLGENTNETYQIGIDEKIEIYVTENLTIIVTDYVEEGGETININLDNQSTSNITYKLGEEDEEQISSNSQVVLETLEPSSELNFFIPEGEYINVEVSGENTNQTFSEATGEDVKISVTENLTIVITDYIEEGGE